MEQSFIITLYYLGVITLRSFPSVHFTTTSGVSCVLGTNLSKCQISKNVLFIQHGNCNWNKIRNLNRGDFCKKSRNRLFIVFLCPHFGEYGFCLYAPGSAPPPRTFFFSNVTNCQVTLRSKSYTVLRLIFDVAYV
jgi:hypothetical protein